MTRPRPILTRVLAVLLLVLPVAGCTSRTTAAPDPTEVATPAVTTAPSLTPTPSPTPTYAVAAEPTRPAAMDTVDVAGAIATATYFAELYPYAYGTGDLTAVNELSHPECIFCKSINDNVTVMQRDGQHTEGPATRVLSATGSELDPGVAFAVEAQVEQQGMRVLDAAGNVVRVDDSTQVYPMTFSIWREGDRWLVRAAEVRDE